MPRLFRDRALWAGLLVFSVLAVLLLRQFNYELRSYAVLTRFADPTAANAILRVELHPVSAQDLAIPVASNITVPARLYLPQGVAHPPGMVVVHGIHHLGIDEPRLVNFSRAIAASGFAVLTPQISALADYHVDAQSIATIGESARLLQTRLGRGPVTLTGISFAGGLALLAAANANYAPHIRLLALMGAYDDLARVSRFLVTNEAVLPDGTREPYTAYEYGALVFVYANLSQFFEPADLPAAHDALRYWLWEQPQQAAQILPQLSPDGRATMQKLFSHRVDDLRPQILAQIESEQSQLAAISPAGKLANLRIPVFILHGSTDDIIPSTESLWLEREIPSTDLAGALVTPAFSHVDPDKHMRLLDELRLVNFIARFLQAAN